MKVTLTFDLPEEKDELLSALHSSTYCSTLLNIDREIRSRLKYFNNENAADLVKFLEDLRSSLFHDLAHTNWRE